MIMDKLKLYKFQKENIPELMQFLYESYFQNNPGIYSNFDTRQQFQTSTIILLQAFIDAAQFINLRDNTVILFNTYTKQDDKIVSTSFNCQINYYIDFLETKFGTPDFFALKNKMSLQFKGVISVRNCVRKSHQNKKLFTRHLLQQSQHLAQHGYVCMYVVAANPIALKMFLRTGGVMLNRIPLQSNGIQFQDCYLECKCSEIIKTLTLPKDLS